MNEAEKKLREAWAKAGDFARGCVCNWAREDTEALGHAIRAFCESEPSAPAVVEPEALRKVREAWANVPADHRERDLAFWRNRHFASTPEYVALRASLADLLESAPVEGGGEYAAKLAAIKEDRDKLEAAFERIVPLNVREQDGTVEGMERWIRANLAHAFGCPKSADHELRAKLALVEKERDATKRSYTEQIAELTRALESEKKAHGEALRPERAVDRELREALKGRPDWIDEDYFTVEASRRAARALKEWLAAPLTAPKVEPARVLECWASEYPNGYLGLTLRSLADPVKLDPSAIRAHRVALPVIETVERGQ